MMVRASEPPMKPFRFDGMVGFIQPLLFLLKYRQFIFINWPRQEPVLFTSKLCHP